MGAAIVVLFFVPWLDRSPVRSIRYKGPIYKVMLALFSVSFICLGGLRHETAVGHLSDSGANLHRRVFRILFADALVHEVRQREAGAGKGYGTCLKPVF